MEKKRFELLKQFAALLGWGELEQFQHAVRNVPGLKGEVLITWYESGSFEDILFQINELPSLCAAVYAVRFRICTGWHAFELHGDLSSLRAETDRLDEWLNRRWFDTIEGRRTFRKRHPECAGYTLTKLRKQGPPHEV
jgi:hypothetical protein